MYQKTHQPCDDCGSSDGLSVYLDGHSYCNVCRKYTKKEEELLDDKVITRDQRSLEATLEVTEEKIEQPLSDKQHRGVTPLAKHFPPLEDRGIDSKSAEKYQTRAVLNDELPNVRHVYPYFNKLGEHIGNKCRTKFSKGFFIEGSLSQAQLFGQQAFPGGGKSLSICEGEIDALSIYQMFDHKYPAVSIQSASSAVKNIQDNYEYVNSFDEIVLCLDTDEPGRTAAEAIAKILPLGKVRVVDFKDGKDANEYLQRGKTKEFVKAWWAGVLYSPVGLKHAKDMWDIVRVEPQHETVPYPWDGLNDLTYGIRLSEMVTVTADPKIGKTQVLREVVYNILKTDASKRIGVMFLEEPNRETLLGLMSLAGNKPLHLPDIRASVTEEELKAYFDQVYKDDRVIVWDHFGSNRVDKVLDYVRYMAALGCKHIILDHLSIIVSDQHGDERKQLDEIATKLKQATIELNVSVICVVHQNRKGEIRGTMGIEQLSNIVIKLYRNKLADSEEERNTMKVSVEDNRFCGRTGPACLLRYDQGSGRLVELSKEAMEEFLKGDKKKDEEW